MLFTHSELRKRQLMMIFQGFSCSMLFYGISIAGSGLTDNPYTDFTWQSVAEIPGILIAIVLLDLQWTGRRGSLVSAASLRVHSFALHACARARGGRVALGGVAHRCAISYRDCLADMCWLCRFARIIKGVGLCGMWRQHAAIDDAA